MFNFHGPPSHLIPSRARMSVSDTTGPHGARPQPRASASEVHIGRSGGNLNSNSNGAVSLPPIAKTRSLTRTGPGDGPQGSASQKGFSYNRNPRLAVQSQSLSQTNLRARRLPPEPKKLPTPREMLLLTLTHVKTASPRGLNFDQLSSFIRGAFEIPKTIAWESKLSKTLSNMVSKGLVHFNPGLSAHDSTYQIAEANESTLDLSVSGKSVPQLPAWPTGLTLPNGSNLICRSGPKLQPIEGFQPYEGGNQQQQLQTHTRSWERIHARPNPRNLKPDPMPYMPVADPMICQSFGVRAGLVNSNGFLENRPNSPINSDAGCYGNQDDGDGSIQVQGRPTSESPYGFVSIGAGSLWKPVMPSASPRSPQSSHKNNGTIAIMSKEMNPYRQTAKKPAPRILDTISGLDGNSIVDLDDLKNPEKSHSDLNPDRDLNSQDEGDEEVEEIFINRMDDDGLSLIAESNGNKNNQDNTRSFHSLALALPKNSNLTRTNSQSNTLSKYGLHLNSKTGSGKLTMEMEQPPSIFKKKEPLENFDIFAGYAGETRAEYEINSRSCNIMNDFGIKKKPTMKKASAVGTGTSTGTASPALGVADSGGAGDWNSEEISEVASKSEAVVAGKDKNFESRMDYLMGIADIIGGYDEEPPELRKSGTGTGSRSKPSLSRTKPSPTVSRSSSKSISAQGATFRKI